MQSPGLKRRLQLRRVLYQVLGLALPMKRANLLFCAHATAN